MPSKRKSSGSELAESRNIPDWKALTPAPLHSAVSEIRKRFASQACKVYDTMQQDCYPALREKTRQAPEPIIFQHYFHDCGQRLGGELQRAFAELLEIALANSATLKHGPVEYAELHCEMLIQEQEYLIGMWLKAACDKQDLREQDPDEVFYWKSWRAPKWLKMQPFANPPYNSATAWDRQDEAGTEHILRVVRERFNRNLCIALKKAAGRAHILVAQGKLAKQAKAAARAEARPRILAVQPDPPNGRIGLARKLMREFLQAHPEGTAPDFVNWADENAKPVPDDYRTGRGRWSSAWNPQSGLRARLERAYYREKKRLARH